jgi:glutathione synthase/RimK-type ligase-like ATP-grasp enzyme
MSMPTIAVIAPSCRSGKVPPPSSRPVGRAVGRLSMEGIRVVFGEVVYRSDGDILMDGMEVDGEEWRAAAGVRIHAIHDRYPSQNRREAYERIIGNSGGLPIGNHPAVTALCRDKLECQRWLERFGIDMPEVVSEPSLFQDRLSRWGGGYIKPRYGAMGVGVQLLVPGQAFSKRIPGATGEEEPAILQRPVSPPSGWAGLSLRVLAQRESASAWIRRPGVLRRSRHDPVVNAARGAEVLPAGDGLPQETLRKAAELVEDVCRCIEASEGGHLAAEVGVDLVLDASYRPWVIEVNSRPRGRLESLASILPDRFGALHEEACVQPIRFLADFISSWKR